VNLRFTTSTPYVDRASCLRRLLGTARGPATAGQTGGRGPLTRAAPARLMAASCSRRRRQRRWLRSQQSQLDRTGHFLPQVVATAAPQGLHLLLPANPTQREEKKQGGTRGRGECQPCQREENKQGGRREEKKGLIFHPPSLIRAAGGTCSRRPFSVCMGRTEHAGTRAELRPRAELCISFSCESCIGARARVSGVVTEG
jgi:hypothetical protein